MSWIKIDSSLFVVFVGNLIWFTMCYFLFQIKFAQKRTSSINLPAAKQHYLPLFVCLFVCCFCCCCCNTSLLKLKAELWWLKYLLVSRGDRLPPPKLSYFQCTPSLHVYQKPSVIFPNRDTHLHRCEDHSKRCELSHCTCKNTPSDFLGKTNYHTRYNRVWARTL